mgnify:CR=1 FL=1
MQLYGNNKGIVNGNIGLINYDELIYAGVKSGVSYLYNLSIPWWTMSPAGLYSSNSFIWLISKSGDIRRNNPHATSYTLRPVLNLNLNTQISDGDGTKDNPFVIQ